MTGPEVRKISSLRDLPGDIAPPRDLWKGIEARLDAGAADAEASSAGAPGAAAPGVRTSRVGGGGGSAGWRRRLARPEWMRVLSAAAVIAALAVGIWIGRAGSPIAGPPAVSPIASQMPGGQTEMLHAAFRMDARYTHQREQLAKDLQARLDALPPESREKVIASLATLRKSIQDLEAALGRDPTNALLQELLVNSYQDEMRVLTAVHDAGNAGEVT